MLAFLGILLNAAIAQELTIKSLAASPMDLSASQYERKDLAGQPCGLVKVQLAAMGAKFEGNVVGQTEYKTGEYWVYMTEGSYMLTVKHPSFVPLDINFRDYGISGVLSKTTYKLTLLMPSAMPDQMDAGASYLVMTVKPVNATVMVDGNLQQVTDGAMRVKLSYGSHRYQVMAAGYASKEGTVEISSGRNKLAVELQSTMAQVSVNCPTAGVEIYVDESLKGKSPWSGQLPAGIHDIEARLSGYRSHIQSVQLKEREHRTIDLPELIAKVGSLDVDYQPVNAEVWIDDKLVGESPDIFQNILVGSHSVEFRANGYTSKQERVTIEEGKTTILTGALERPAAIETFKVKGVSFNMVRVEGGTFMMGATAEQGNNAWDDEKPAHQVTLSIYSIGETEVTQALWEAVMGSNPSHFKGNNRPVENVSWDDCQTFVEKLSQLTGRRFRLPTETEWEYAARGGSKSRGYKYSGSNNIDEVAWYTKTTNDNGTRDVKTKKANELGLYDMSGNVYEWCQDWFGNYSSEAQTNPTGPETGSFRVYRGGCWQDTGRDCRVSMRGGGAQDHSGQDLGLRLALSVK